MRRGMVRRPPHGPRATTERTRPRSNSLRGLDESWCSAPSEPPWWRSPSGGPAAVPCGSHFTSNRRTLDHGPAAPDGELARTRHHMRRAGSVLVVKSEPLTVSVATAGAENLSSSSIWIV